MGKFAEATKVPVDQSRREIEQVLKRWGAERFAYFSMPGSAIIVFESRGRRLKFTVPLPEELPRGADIAKDHRQKWRALLLTIKAKLASVEGGIETFEEAFLAHVVMPSGATVYEHAAPKIAALYKGEPMQPLLPAPRKEGTP